MTARRGVVDCGEVDIIEPDLLITDRVQLDTPSLMPIGRMPESE